MNNAELKVFWDEYKVIRDSKRGSLGVLGAHKFALNEKKEEMRIGYPQVDEIYQRSNETYCPKLQPGVFKKYKEEMMKKFS